jgi:hypothetical protein
MFKIVLYKLQIHIKVITLLEVLSSNAQQLWSVDSGQKALL